MRGMRIEAARGPVVASCVAVWLLSGCGGNEFASGGAAGSGGSVSSTAGTPPGGSDAAGTDAGGSTSGSGGSASGSGGSGGSATSCSCSAGSYCRDGSKDCYACSELSRLKFHPPQRLSTLSDGMGSRFPRVGGTGTDLLYQFSGVGLRYTTDSSSSAGSTVAQTTPQDSGPLLLPTTISSLPPATFNFVFDRSGEGTRRELLVGQWDNGLQGAGALAPPPFNDSTGSSNFALAIAYLVAPAARGYWMSDRVQSGAFELQSALFVAEAPAQAVELRVAPSNCATDHTDLTPWVTPDGSILLFSHDRLGDGCQSAGQGKDIYTALLVPSSGQVLPGAEGPTQSQPLADVNSGKDDTDPSFSADFCDLYFSSNRDGEYALYRAHRR